MTNEVPELIGVSFGFPKVGDFFLHGGCNGRTWAGLRFVGYTSLSGGIPPPAPCHTATGRGQGPGRDGAARDGATGKEGEGHGPASFPCTYLNCCP